MAARIDPALTLWHEHTPAGSGRSAGPNRAPLDGRSMDNTSAGVGIVRRAHCTSIG
jgi:hypothetical protein